LEYRKSTEEHLYKKLLFQDMKKIEKDFKELRSQLGVGERIK